jgi:hypothetical protein
MKLKSVLQHFNSDKATTIFTKSENRDKCLEFISIFTNMGFNINIIRCINIEYWSVDLYFKTFKMASIYTSRDVDTIQFHIFDGNRQVPYTYDKQLIKIAVTRSTLINYAEEVIKLHLNDRYLELNSNVLVVKGKSVISNWYDNFKYDQLFTKSQKLKFGPKGMIAKLKIDGYDFVNPEVIPSLISEYEMD